MPSPDKKKRKRSSQTSSVGNGHPPHPPTINEAKMQLDEGERTWLNDHLTRGSICLMLDGEDTPATKVIIDQVARWSDENRAELVMVLGDSEDEENEDGRIELTIKEIMRGAEAAWSKGYYQVDRYLKLEQTSKGTKVKVLWNTGEVTSEPLSNLKEDDPVGLAQWAIENGFQRLKQFAWARKYSSTTEDQSIQKRQYCGYYSKNGKYTMKFETENSNIKHSILLSDAKEDDRVNLAKWAMSEGLQNHSRFLWIKSVLRDEQEDESHLEKAGNPPKKSNGTKTKNFDSKENRRSSRNTISSSDSLSSSNVVEELGK